ncbi:ABC transporter permease subunit [Virgibacillus kekensis]|uniref:ABC transporter permease subunit n=1 Tax=Virgibacillus kekensis TaxID=202261 RepID=A0ABV9DED7_9BACI
MDSFVSRISGKFILGLVGIFLIGALPSLFNGVSMNLGSYIAQLTATLPEIIRPWEMSQMIGGFERPLFPRILDPWGYSMTLLLGAFSVAFLVAMALAFFTFLLPRKLIKIVKFILFSLESVPDVLVMILFQTGAIWIHMQTGERLFYVVEYGGHQPYTLPIIALSILPTIFLFRIFILDFEEQADQPYVEMATAKGLKNYLILWKHILRNAIMGMFLHTRFILWVMLSNLLVAELVFGINGLIQFMYTSPTPEIFTLGILLFFVPIFAVLAIGQFIIEKATSQKVVL